MYHPPHDPQRQDIRRRAVLCRVGILLAATTAVGAAHAGQGDPALDRLLNNLNGVARLYADTALRFACDETITARPGGTHRFEYIYVFGADGKFNNYRTRPGSRRGKEVHLDAYPLPRWVSQAYSWAFIFWRNRSSRFRYERLGENAALGRPAILVRFEPIPPIEPDLNDWFGTAWIDRETWQFLRVEAQTPEAFAERGRFQRHLWAGPRARPARPGPARFQIEWVTTEFAVEKNGMRFPSKVVIEMSDYAVPGRRQAPFEIAPVYRVEQTYSNYRFFSVRTADEIRRILSPLPDAP